MSAHYFTVGDPISFKGRSGVIDYYDGGTAVIKLLNCETIAISHIDLADAYRNGEVSLTRRSQYNPCHIRLDDDQAKNVILYEKYCIELSKEARPCGKGVRERVIALVAKEFDDPNPPSIAKIHRIYKKWIENGKNMVHVLCGNQRCRRSVISDEVYNLMDEIIVAHYFKPSRPTAKRAYREFKKVYKDRQYISNCPSLSTFERRIKTSDRLECIRQRYGENAAREEARTATSKTKLSHALELVSMDAAHFNCGLKNMFGFYVGMPSIYFVMDDYSRVILGYGIHVGKHSESTACMVHTLRYAISKKNDPLYPFYGLPATIIVDQGAAYVSENAIRFFSGLQVNFAKTATRMGWGKPMIERFIRTARAGFFSDLEGYLGKLDKRFQSSETVKKAAVHTVSEFRQMFSEFIVDYHNTPHSGLNGRTPAEVWAESVKSFPPSLPEDMPYTQLMRGVCYEKKLKHVTGITIDYQTFNSDKLQRLYHELEPSMKPGVRSEIKVTTYHDPLDASAISVVNPRTNELIEVPNIIADEAKGMSFAELRSKRKAMITAQEAPVMDGGVREQYSKTQRRKGPDVPLDDFDNPIDLDLILVSPSKPIASVKSGFEIRTLTDDEDDDYVVTID